MRRGAPDAAKSKKQRPVLREAPGDRDRAGAAPAAPTAAPATPEEALERILAPWRRSGEGIRHGLLGDSGTGKSVHMRWLLAAMLAEGVCELAFVLDDKGRPQYTPDAPELAGLNVDQRVNLAHADEDTPGASIVAFRGDFRAGITCHPEELAARQLQLMRQDDPVRVALFLDEIKRATNAQEDGDGRKFTAPSVRLVVTEGRSEGASVVWGNQSPQELPRSAVNNASTIAIHRLGPNAANYVGGTWLFPTEMVEAIKALRKFEFVLFEPGKTEWDGRIYEVPHPPEWE